MYVMNMLIISLIPRLSNIPKGVIPRAFPWINVYLAICYDIEAKIRLSKYSRYCMNHHIEWQQKYGCRILSPRC